VQQNSFLKYALQIGSSFLAVNENDQPTLEQWWANRGRET